MITVLQFRYHIIITVILVLLLKSCDASIDEPVAIYLTWQQDPTSTMTIDWHTTPDDKAEPILYYKEVGADEWREIAVSQKEFPHSDRLINRIELTGLQPATYYRFRVGEFQRNYKFRTMPTDLSKPIRFITGGDTHHERHTMSAQAMLHDPDFIVWGGDLSYADGDPGRVYRWYNWFDGIRENLISDDGRVVPIIVAIGNHEVFSGSRLLQEGGRHPHDEMTEDEAREFIESHDLWDGKGTFFFELFAFPGEPAYNVLDFSDYLSLVILDSGHNSPIDGDQLEWLDETLSAREGRPHVIPVYHVPAYPSYRDFSHSRSTLVRESWVPLFEKYGIRVAFENHDHTYKRTYPLRGEQISSDGVVFIGDGNWGRADRDTDNRDAWYIKEFAGGVRHGIIATLHGTHQHFLVIDEDGNVIDEYPERPSRN